MDFLIYQDHPFHGYEYILCVVDVFLRKAAARATTNQKGPTYTELLREIIKEDFGERWPTDLNCDQEFKFGFKKEDPKGKGKKKASFMRLLTDHNVTVHFLETEEVNKNSIVERFIRTVREMLVKATWALDQPNWSQLFPSLIANYNKTYHRTIWAKLEAVFKQEVSLGQVLTRA